MKRPRLALLSILLVLVPAAGIIYLLSAPGIRNLSPADGATNVPSQTPLRITFSRRMQPDMVTSRLSINPPTRGKFTWEGSTLVFTADGGWPSGQKVTITLAPGAETTGVVSFTFSKETRWTFTTGYPSLVYLYPADGPANLYAMSALSGSSRALTNSSQGLVDFSVSKSGALYYSQKASNGGASLYRIDRYDPASADPPTASLVLDCQADLCRSPQASPDGSLLAYERTPAGSEGQTFPQVWLLPLQNGASPSLAAQPGHETIHPAWSSAGLLSYYDTNLSAYVILDPASSQATTFPNQTGEPAAWSPDGSSLVTSELGLLPSQGQTNAGSDTLQTSRLLRYDPRAHTTTDLSASDAVDDASPAFSPDGKRLAFARREMKVERWTPGRQLWLMSADGRDLRQLTDNPFFNHFDFAWNPTGDQLAFVRFDQTNMTNPPEIWLADPVSGRVSQLVTGGFSPQWIP